MMVIIDDDNDHHRPDNVDDEIGDAEDAQSSSSS